MKAIPVFFALAAVALAMPQSSVKYEIDINRIAAGDDHLLRSYVNCFLDREPCTFQQEQLKMNFENAIQSGCSSCTPEERQAAHKMVSYMVNERPDTWREVAVKYDSNDEHKKKFVLVERSNSGTKVVYTSASRS